MPTFKYLAKGGTGETVAGTLTVANRGLVVEALRKQGLVVLGVREVAAPAPRRGATIKLDELVIFSRQLATLVDAGIPLVTSLDTLHAQLDQPGLKTVIGRIRDDVEGGSNFTEALAKHPTIFPTLFVSMVKAGEASGALAEILDRLAGYLEKTTALERKVRSSLVYPAVVVCMALSITLFLILKVVPTFKGIFLSLGGTLPLPTQILLAVSDTCQRYLVPVAAAGVILVVLLRRWTATPAGRLWLDRGLLRLPIFGLLLRKVAVARFARTLTTLTRSGVPILASLDIVGRTAGNRVVELAVERIRSSIREGETIAKPLEAAGIFPPLVVRMVGVGEQTGQLEKMLTKIAEFYESEVDTAVNSLTSIIEPVIIAILGVVIGGIVIAIFLPIVKVTQYLGH
ncbi:MAG: hypothetical protein A3C53_00995 [Omnitrophica WOR_2 bacterium RIFCSPHIGHO2_02_FULL_68_15]|nr:MAG: hypothetical protein A3C53_00995 [Omnitrophica WOR_2 bacterium RIFCSPHIGHO2_02_FULL_68_15]